MSDRMLFDLMGVAGMASAFICVWYIVASWQIRALKRRQNIMMPYCHLAWHAAAAFCLWCDSVLSCLLQNIR